MDLKKKLNENDKQFIWRLCSAKVAGTLVKTWDELADIFNKELRSDGTELTKDSYRKPYENATAWYEDVFSKMMDTEYADEIKTKTDELFKIKRQVSDQRREYNKLLVADSRAEHLTSKLVESANSLNIKYPMLQQDEIHKVQSGDTSEAMLFFADWHYGMITENIWNTYNTDICRQRVSVLVRKCKEYLRLHKVNKLHIVLLGDECHGGIHNSARVKSEEDVCDQLMHVTEIIAQAVFELSHEVEFVDVHSTYGNHMRTIQNKNDSIHSDNMEKVIPWWLEQRFKTNDKINILYSDYYEFIKLNVLGYNVCCMHGDLDSIKKVGSTMNTLFTRLYGETIDYTVSADKHHLEEFEEFDIENVLVRSLCGTDDYANNKRLYSKAGQTLMIFTKEDGRQATYNIKLN